MRFVFDTAGWGDYQWWQANDRRMLERINLLIDDALRDPGAGRRQPERLKHRASLSGAVTGESSVSHRATFAQIGR